MTRPRLDAAHSLPPPITKTQLGPWRLGRLLAESALASVFQAKPIRDEGAGEREAIGERLQYGYALKRLRPRWDRDEQAAAMFALEAFVGRRVAHSNLVSVLDAQVKASPRFLVMPEYRGHTLARLLRRGERLPVPAVLWTLRQMAAALSALHRAGWLHGDVKPHNVLLAADGHATLLDLGFVRPIEEAGNVTERPLLGTLRYIAPELICSSLRGDGRSDLYSLGVMAFEMLAGRAPFRGNSAAELVEQHRFATPPDLRSLAPRVPEDVAGLVHALIAKDPDRRPATADELVARLVRLELETFDERLEELLPPAVIAPSRGVESLVSRQLAG